ISADAILKVLVANGISPQSMPKEYSQLFEVQKKAAEQEKMKVAQEQAKWKAEHQDVLSKFKEGNPQVKELLKQSDKYFKDKKDVIYRSGCVFRDIQSVCEIASGTTLTRQQIVDIWDDATAKKYLTESGSIASEIAYEKIAELTLAKLGRTDIGFQFGKNSYGGNIVAYLGKMPYSNEDSHSAVYLSKDDGYKMKPFYNPGQTNAKTYADKWKEIYIYGKKK
ncbi:MAG TPA: hypothetical protein VN132_11520, partial [Bdellovibrio sp.]|nr:hypothetical protein [Bdellovibrio sp.]